jgi:serine/threonine protein kinase
MHYAFQDKEYLYLILDHLGGGDLRYHLIKNQRFSEEKTSKFFLIKIKNL